MKLSRMSCVMAALLVATLAQPTSASAALPARDGLILSVDSDQLIVTDLSSGRVEMHRLTDESEAATARWSPDGSSILVGTQQGQIYTMHADGSGKQVIGSGYEPDWSPADLAGGPRIVFTGTDDQIWTMTTTGADPQRLTEPQRSVCTRTRPSWSPDGSLISYVLTRRGEDRGCRFTADNPILISILDLANDTSTLVNDNYGRAGDLIWTPRFTSDGAQIQFVDINICGWTVLRANVVSLVKTKVKTVSECGSPVAELEHAIPSPSGGTAQLVFKDRTPDSRDAVISNGTRTATQRYSFADQPDWSDMSVQPLVR